MVCSDTLSRDCREQQSHGAIDIAQRIFTGILVRPDLAYQCRELKFGLRAIVVIEISNKFWRLEVEMQHVNRNMEVTQDQTDKADKILQAQSKGMSEKRNQLFTQSRTARQRQKMDSWQKQRSQTKGGSIGGQ